MYSIDKKLKQCKKKYALFIIKPDSDCNTDANGNHQYKPGFIYRSE